METATESQCRRWKKLDSRSGCISVATVSGVLIHSTETQKGRIHLCCGMVVQIIIILTTNMKLSATLKNNRGGQKTTADDTRLSVELRYGNKAIGTIWVYMIKDWSNRKGIGYRILLDNEVIRLEIEKGKQQTGN